MAQTNSEYWEQRIANNTWSTYNSLEEKNRALLEMYQEASLNIQEELYQMAQKINGGKGISLSDMHKFNRLKALKANFENVMRKLGEDVEKFGKDNMREGFNKVYNNVMTELGQTDFVLPNEKLMEEMMNKPWEGGNFSSRLWKNTQVLASNLNELLTIGLQQGKTVTEIAIQLNDKMHNGFGVSHRLVRTETMHYLNESAFKAYQDGGCEEVELWAAEDERTCDTCGAKHGTKYKLKDRPVLPLHANCRCTYLPVVDMESIKKSDKGAINGALNNSNDPEWKLRDEHAEKYYNSIKNSKKESFVKNVAKNSGMQETTISKIYDHVFKNKYELSNGYSTFAPDYDMAESFRRLREGKNIQEHDIIMLNHERLEYQLMNRYNMKYIEAHKLADTKYNYNDALVKYKKDNNLV